MDKRYKKHLASVSSVQKTSSNGIGPQPTMDTFTRHHNRRASWHGKMKQDETDNPPSGPAYPLGSGFESGSEESLSSSVADSTYCDDATESGILEEQHTDQVQDNELDAFADKDDSAVLPVEMKAIIQERVQQYKSQMMELWMKEAEEKIAAMEQDYMRKMNNQKLFHLSSNGEKGPETFV